MNANHPRRRGFSLVEILIIVAVIGVVSTIAIPFVAGVPDAAKKEKLEQDVVVVNNAIDAYLASGGDAGQLTSGNLLTVLKSRVYGGMPAEMMGPQGPFLDLTVTTNATDFDWSASFTAEPRPRFVVAKNKSGVIFGKGPAMAVGGVAERPDEARPNWLWGYADATPPPDAVGYTPLAIDTGSSFTTVPLVGVTLGAPLVSPGGLTTNLWGFPLSVTMTNTNPPGSSRIYYKVGTGNFSLFEDNTALSIGPTTSLVAVCVSLDPSRYYNSAMSSNFFGVIPFELSVQVGSPGSVTYAQAGGLLQGIGQLQPVAVTVSLATNSSVFIPAPYLRDANFFVRYTTDGSSPLTNGITGPAFNGFFSPVSVPLGLAAWGTNSSIEVRAAAIAVNTNLFLTSEPAAAISTISPMALPLAIVPANPIGLPFQVQISESAPFPVGLRKFYTTDGTAPLTQPTAGLVRAAAISYSSAVPSTSLPSTAYTLTAQATGPPGFEQWFASPLASRNYTTITVLNPDFVGANISGGDVNGSFRGSIFVAAPANLGIFNAGGQILSGNLYVPGLPGIEIPGSGNRGKDVVARGAAFVDSPGLIPRSLIAGKELSATGLLAVPQLDTRQVVDLSGSGALTNYTIKLTKNSFIEGKIYRNVDVPPPPPVPVLPQGLTIYTNAVTGDPATNLPTGVYTNTINVSEAAAVLRLGVAGSAVVSQYIFGPGTWSRGRVEIVGPVEVFFTTGWTNSGVVFGATNTQSQLRVNVLGGDVDIKAGGALYGSIYASQDISVGNRGILFGNIFAQFLNVAPGGTVNVEPQAQP